MCNIYAEMKRNKGIDFQDNFKFNFFNTGKCSNGDPNIPK